MGPMVRTVCVACLQSLEVSSEEEYQGRAICPHCGSLVHLLGMRSSSSTTGDAFASPPPLDPDALTPKSGVTDRRPPGQIGRFLLREPLGEGGYGQVFRAFDPHLERDVALKILKQHRIGEKALERFYREARAAARLDHPNIVGLHDAGRDEDRCWIAYQLVPGVTLSTVRDLDRPSIDASVRIIRDLALALEHAHRRGVYHRDLKPANVLIDDSGRPRLTDFGLARRGDVSSELTQEGTVLGTPQYMSPEAAAGRAREADGRSDVYSLGVILYELICGQRPCEVPSHVAPWWSKGSHTPPTPRSVDRAIPLDLDRICMKALAFDPNARFADAQSLADALSRYLLDRPDPHHFNRRSPMSSLAIGLIVAASVLCLVLGMSLQVGGGHRGDRLAIVPSSVAIQPTTGGLVSSSTQPVAQKQALAKVQEQNPLVLEPPNQAELARDQILNESVVKTPRGNTKFHLKTGCRHTKGIDPAVLIDLGDARTVLAQKQYLPCRDCLGILNLTPESTTVKAP